MSKWHLSQIVVIPRHIFMIARSSLLISLRLVASRLESSHEFENSKTYVPYMVVLALFYTLALNINYKQASPFVSMQNTPFSYYIHGTTLVPKCIYATSSSKIAPFQNSLGICNILSICQCNPSS